MKKRDELPSKRAEREALEKAELADKRNAEQVRLRGAMHRVFKGPDGKIVLEWLMRECGYGHPIIGANAMGDIDEKRTLYGAFRLNLWWKLRKLLPINILKEVEYVDHE